MQILQELAQQPLYVVSLASATIALILWLSKTWRSVDSEEVTFAEALDAADAKPSDIKEAIVDCDIPRVWIKGRSGHVKVRITPMRDNPLIQTPGQPIVAANEMGVKLSVEKMSFEKSFDDDERQPIFDAAHGPLEANWDFELEPKKAGKFVIKVTIRRYKDGKPIIGQSPVTRSRTVEVGVDAKAVAKQAGLSTLDKVIGGFIGVAVGTLLGIAICPGTCIHAESNSTSTPAIAAPPTSKSP